jgi:flagellar protein FliO/FliZ
VRHAHALAASVVGCPAIARAAAPAPDAANAGSLLQATLGLARVLALIIGVAWLARRFTPGAMRGGAPLTIVASQAVGQRERVVVVEVADQWLVLGVAPGHVSSLGTLPKGSLSPTTPATTPFSSALSRALGRRG